MVKQQCIKYFGALLSIWCLSLPTWAQGTFPSTKGAFSINYLKGCEGTPFDITYNNPSGYGQGYFCVNDCYDATGENIDRNKFSQTIPNFEQALMQLDTGSHIIVMFADPSGINGTTLIDSLRIHVYPPLPLQAFAKPCNGGVVYVDAGQNGTAYDSVTVNFGDGSPLVAKPLSDLPISHTYSNTTNTYNIIVHPYFDASGNNNCSNAATDTLQVNPSSAGISTPDIPQVEIVDSTHILIQSNWSGADAYYALNKGSTSTLSFYQNIFNTGNASYALKDAMTQDYYFQLSTDDPCTNQSISSNLIKSLPLSARDGNNGVILSWPGDNSIFQQYEVRINGQSFTTTNANYVDTTALCGIPSSYQVIGRTASGAVSISQTLAYTPQNIPNQYVQKEIRASVNGSSITIFWPYQVASDTPRFVLYRAKSLNNFEVVDTVNGLSYTDSDVTPATQSYFYKVGSLDACGQVSQLKNYAHSILLNGTPTSGGVDFTWNLYEGFENGVNNQQLERFDKTGTPLGTITVGAQATDYSVSTSTTQQQNLFYRVAASNASGETVYSNIFSYEQPAIIMAPGAFTPNGDGRNDIFVIQTRFVKSIELRIFNRWGNMLFFTDNLNEGWDGNFSGRPAPTGAYVYQVIATDEEGNQYKKQGTFILLKR